MVRMTALASVQVCSACEPVQQILPTGSEDFLRPDHARPFSFRHAIQQASIIGNLGHAGLLQVTFVVGQGISYRQRLPDILKHLQHLPHVYTLLDPV